MVKPNEFRVWLAEINLVVEEKTGLSLDDFADWQSRDTFDAGCSVEEGLDAFIQEQDDSETLRTLIFGDRDEA